MEHAPWSRRGLTSTEAADKASPGFLCVGATTYASLCGQLCVTS